jgi:DNA-binding PadR family transcriptional regulator
MRGRADGMELDAVVHGPLRLATLALLAAAGPADFIRLRERTGATDGNLGANLAKLERAGYVAVTKQFIGNRPNSSYRITAEGRKALRAYARTMRVLLHGAGGEEMNRRPQARRNSARRAERVHP